MEISIEHFDGTYPSFNVSLSSAAGKKPFLVVKGCKIANGKDGEFVSGPSTKSQKTGDYWNHTFFSKEFGQAVLEKAQVGMPRQSSEPTRKAKPDFDGDVPF
jgi:DNA-binding cell septation regulator SpoVG